MQTITDPVSPRAIKFDLSADHERPENRNNWQSYSVQQQLLSYQFPTSHDAVSSSPVTYSKEGGRGTTPREDDAEFSLSSTARRSSTSSYRSSNRKRSVHRRSGAVTGGSSDIESIFSAQDGKSISTGTSTPPYSPNRLLSTEHKYSFDYASYKMRRNSSPFSKKMPIDLSPAGIDPYPSTFKEHQGHVVKSGDDPVDLNDFLKESANHSSLCVPSSYDPEEYLHVDHKLWFKVFSSQH